MNNQTTLYIVRHGESESNAAAQFNDVKLELGSNLTDKGKAQAQNLANKLKYINIDAIYSSDLNRAKQTAQIIASTKKIDVITSNLIRERDFNEYATKINKDKKILIEELIRDLKLLEEKDKLKYKQSPFMESAEEGALRLLNFIKQIMETNKGKTALIVAHGNIMRSLLTYLNFAKYDELPSGTVENTGYFVLTTDGINFSVENIHRIHKQYGKVRSY
jgi:broad specificity phosphatase PhoE